MKKVMKNVLVIVLMAILVSSCGGGQSAPTIEERLTEHGERIAVLEEQMSSLLEPESTPTESASCDKKPASLIDVDLDEFATVRIPYFPADLDFVLELFPIEVVMETGVGSAKNQSNEEMLRHPVWFIANGGHKSTWLTGQGVNIIDATAVVFPAFVSQSKFAVDLHMGPNGAAYMAYDSADLPDIVAWIISCDVGGGDIGFFGAQHISASEYIQLSQLLPWIMPNK